MYDSDRRHHTGTGTARFLTRLLLLIACNLVLAACQSLSQAPVDTEQEIEQPQPVEQEPEPEPEPEKESEPETEPEPNPEPEPEPEPTPEQPPEPAVDELMIHSDVTAINLGSIVTVRVTVQATLVDGTAGSPGAVEWSLSDETVAVITPLGNEHSYSIGDTLYEEISLRGLQVGTVDLTATAAGQSASITVDVEDYAAGMSLLPESLQLTFGSNPEETIEASLILASGQTAPLAYVTWFSSDTRVATIEDGLVTAVSEGTAIISAFAAGYLASIEVSVSDPVTQLSIVEPPEDLKLGGSRQLQAELVMASGTTTPAPADTEWTSSNPGVVSVSSSGLLTAHTQGTATIRASAGSNSAEFTVTAVDHVTAVTFHRRTGVQVDQLLLYGMANSTIPVELTATLHYHSGATEPAGTQLEWESTAPNTARMNSQNRIITAHTVTGAAILQATHPESGTSAQLIVTVIWPEANN